MNITVTNYLIILCQSQKISNQIPNGWTINNINRKYIKHLNGCNILGLVHSTEIQYNGLYLVYDCNILGLVHSTEIKYNGLYLVYNIITFYNINFYVYGMP